jgi:hypothetical protein
MWYRGNVKSWRYLLEIVSEDGKIESCNVSYLALDGVRNNLIVSLQQQPSFILQLDGREMNGRPLDIVKFESCRIQYREFKPKFIHTKEIASSANNHWYRLAVREPRIVGSHIESSWKMFGSFILFLYVLFVAIRFWTTGGYSRFMK